ncbi:unnamed protein product [Owenia fusiformis]|uniref:Apple domain-containing protein n=1 Tax=Owenia fusiformis TaxID=6347 RepID=A0A8S4NJ31_OWEFU|nr:unnamed protein product [Owenia fusiformis]
MNMILSGLLVLMLCIAHSNAGYFWVDMADTCIKGQNMNILSPIPNVLVCKLICETEPSCRSIDYHSGNKVCHLSVKHSGNWQLSAPCYLDGWQYAERRVRSYWTWYDLPNTCIKGQNIAAFTTTSLCACKEACSNYGNGWMCRSIDYKASTKTCHLQEKYSVNTVLSSPCYLSGWLYAERMYV